MEFKSCGKNSKEAEEIGNVYAFLRAISDPNRLKIMCVLRNGPKCVCDIISAIGISDKLASHHLKQLKKVGVLTEKREGTFIHYGLNNEVIGKHKLMFNKIIK